MGDKEIKRIIKQIDDKKFYSELIENTLKENIGDTVRRRKVFNLLKYAVRYSCFIDLYYETKDTQYLREAEKQKTKIFSFLTVEQIKDLEIIEKRIIGFFEYEKDMIDKIKKGLIFSKKRNPPI